MSSDEQVFLVNLETGNKFPLNGFIPSNDESDAPKFAASRHIEDKKLPAAVDLREFMTPVEHQLQLYSCTGNALAGAYEFLIKKNTGRHIDVSRLFMYYNARRKDGMQPYSMQDVGCTIRSAIAAAAEHGCCTETTYPYEPYHVNQQPPATCYSEGRKYRLTRAEKVNANVNEMKACLAEGFPFVFGLKTFQSFARAETNRGVVYMPQPGEQMSANHGWHAMLAAGYSDQLGSFIVRNSWGSKWGDQGYCYIPYSYMGNSQYCQDSHAVKEIMNVSQDASKPVKHVPNPYNWETDKKHYHYSPFSFDFGRVDYQWFWKNLNYMNFMNVAFARPQPTSEENRRTTAIERVSRNTRVAKKFFILWIDAKTPEHQLIAQKLEANGNVEVDFAETFAKGTNYLVERKAKIQSSTRFLIICRGYFRDENKNALDLLKFLDENHLSMFSVIIFTSDKDGLMRKFDEQAPSMELFGWRRRLQVTNETSDFMEKLDYHTKN